MATNFLKFSIEFLASTPKRELRHEGGRACSGYDYMAAIYVKDPSILKDGVIDVETIKENLYTALFFHARHNKPFTITALQCGRFSDGFMFNIGVD